MSIFDRPPADWTDAELQAGAVVVAEARDLAALLGDVRCADAFASLCVVLTAERDARAALYREMDDAAAQAVCRVGEARIIRTDLRVILVASHRDAAERQPFALGIDDRRAPQLGRYLVALGEVFPRRETRWQRLLLVVKRERPEARHHLEVVHVERHRR